MHKSHKSYKPLNTDGYPSTDIWKIPATVMRPLTTALIQNLTRYTYVYLYFTLAMCCIDCRLYDTDDHHVDLFNSLCCAAVPTR